MQIFQKFKNLRLNRNVQGGRRLVRDDKFRIADQSHCDHYPLSHTARQLVRIGFIYPFRHCYADLFQHFDTARFGVFLAYFGVVGEAYFVQLITYREHGIQTCHRLLEYHRDVLAAHFVHCFRRHFDDIVSKFSVFAVIAELVRIKADFAVDDLSLRGLHELHYRKRSNALSATRFPDDADDFLFGNIERNAVDGHNRAHISEETGFKVLDLDKIFIVLHRGRIIGRVGFLAFLLFVKAHLPDVVSDDFTTLF